ncbi:hypothetical protein JW916_15240 [Candidatus Sumerlaeota bacterium]|nr:hypothetical protein [Candidatus Sumerlaeota bacterium]
MFRNTDAASMKPVPFLTGWCLAAVAVAALVLLSSPGRGEEPDPLALIPQLSEIESLYLAPAGSAPSSASGVSPAWLGESPAGGASALRIEHRLHALPGFRKYDLSRPPVRHHWHNMVLYAVGGAPRDLIDMLFGLAGRVPIVNIGITGAMYEVVPSQVLFRHWDSWHRWPGHANRHGEGWIDAECWGFFSNLRYMTFASVNKRKLEAWRAYDARVDEAMAKRNAEIEKENERAIRARSDLLETTLPLYRSGKYQAVVQRLAPYVEIEPSDRRARAMLAASLAALAPRIAERQWAEEFLGEQIRSASKEILVAMKEELKTLAKRDPAQPEPLFWLVWIDTRLRSYGEAIDAAERLVETAPGSVTWLRLRFESAIESGVPKWIEEAARAIEETAGRGAEASVHARGRQALADGRPDEAIATYEHLTRTLPTHGRYHYLLGMALIEKGKQTGRYEKGRALKELKRARKFAASDDDRDLYRRALEAARVFRPSKK